jgi:hypothetical protein
LVEDAMAKPADSEQCVERIIAPAASQHDVMRVIGLAGAALGCQYPVVGHYVFVLATPTAALPQLLFATFPVDSAEDFPVIGSDVTFRVAKLAGFGRLLIGFDGLPPLSL